MITICKGEHCPVRKQCARYTSVLETYKDDCKVILNCRNQRLFTKESPYTISQSTAEELAAAFNAFASFDPVPQFIESYYEHVRLKMVDRYLSIANEYAKATYKATTKSIFTRWWWKRKADKLSAQLDGIMEIINVFSEKGDKHEG